MAQVDRLIQDLLETEVNKRKRNQFRDPLRDRARKLRQDNTAQVRLAERLQELQSRTPQGRIDKSRADFLTRSVSDQPQKLSVSFGEGDPRNINRTLPAPDSSPRTQLGNILQTQNQLGNVRSLAESANLGAEAEERSAQARRTDLLAPLQQFLLDAQARAEVSRSKKLEAEGKATTAGSRRQDKALKNLIGDNSVESVRKLLEGVQNQIQNLGGS